MEQRRWDPDEQALVLSADLAARVNDWREVWGQSARKVRALWELRWLVTVFGGGVALSCC